MQPADREDEDEEDEAAHAVKEEEDDSADEAAQFALHGRQLPRERAGIVSCSLLSALFLHRTSLTTNRNDCLLIVRSAIAGISNSRQPNAEPSSRRRWIFEPRYIVLDARPRILRFYSSR